MLWAGRSSSGSRHLDVRCVGSYSKGSEKRQGAIAESFLEDFDGMSVETFCKEMLHDDIEVTDHQLKKLATLSSLLQQLHQVSVLGERLPVHMCCVCVQHCHRTTHTRCTIEMKLTFRKVEIAIGILITIAGDIFGPVKCNITMTK